MLTELRIAGLGVIDEAVLPLGPGLTVVTGETGAGKTMVITGLQLLFGGRGDSARVRTGSTQAAVDGRLTIDADSASARRVDDAGGALDREPVSGGSELILRRVVSATGRSRAYVGGAPAPVTVLSELAGELLALHGQSDQVRLVRPAAQRSALDRFAGLELGPVRTAFDAWRAAAAALADRTSRTAQLRRESDLLSYGLAEIEAAAPQPDEPEQLAAQAARLGRADSLTAAARAAHDALVGNADDLASDAADVTQLLSLTGRTLAQQSGADPDLDAMAARLIDLAALAADLGTEFGAYASGLDADPARLEQIEQRRAQLASLIRKYCDEPDPSLAGVLRWAAAAHDRLAQIDVSDEAIAALRQRCAAAEEELLARASAASAGRRRAAAELGAAVTAELAGLAMAQARLSVDITQRTPSAGAATISLDGEDIGIGPDGFDDVAFLLTPHRGAPALPIGRGASGGELSRIMLALELCLGAGTGTGDGATVPLMVFDEVDAGVGGRAATEVGRRLARLGRDRQVLVVTHLAQVAACADRHLVVDRPADDRAAAGVTASDVREVSGDDRVAELARMLGGANTATAREHAAELLVDGNRSEPMKASRTPRSRQTGRKKAAS